MRSVEDMISCCGGGTEIHGGGEWKDSDGVKRRIT